MAQMDIADVIGELQNAPMQAGTVYRRQVDALMRHFHKIGLTLEAAGDAKHLGLADETMRRHARRLKLAFPDYVPMALRPAKPKKTPKD